MGEAEDHRRAGEALCRVAEFVSFCLPVRCDVKLTSCNGLQVYRYASMHASRRSPKTLIHDDIAVSDHYK